MPVHQFLKKYCMLFLCLAVRLIFSPYLPMLLHSGAYVLFPNPEFMSFITE